METTKRILQAACCGLILFYRCCLSPFIGSHCRFYPSCSRYSYEAIQRHGLGYGLWLSGLRLLRCHPWHCGGVDIVPNKKKV